MLLGLQVKMAQENLLQHLYTYATHLNPLELEAMLNEDPELMQKRAAAQMAVKVPTTCLPVPMALGTPTPLFYNTVSSVYQVICGRCRS